QQNERHDAERAQFDLTRRDLEQKAGGADEQRTAMEKALRELKNLFSQLEEDNKKALAEHFDARLQLENQCRTAEQQRDAFRQQLQQAEADGIRQAEEQASDRSKWETLQLELEQKLKLADKANADLKEAFEQAEARLEEHSAGINLDFSRLESECREWEKQFTETEQKRRALLDEIERERTERKQENEKYQSERDGWEQQKKILEQALFTEEFNRKAMQDALLQADAHLTSIAEKHNAERENQKLARHELEKKLADSENRCSFFQTALKEAESNSLRLLERHNEEHVRHENERCELQHKLLDAEKSSAELQAALHEAATGITELTAKHEAERARLDDAVRQQERKYIESEQLRAALQSALNEVESNLAKLAEKQRVEFSQYEFSLRKAEQKYQAVEKQLAVLHSEHEDSIRKLARITDNYNAERSEWNSLRTGLEEKFQAAEKEHTAALQNVVRDAESRLAWISEQNQAKAVQLETIQREMERLHNENRKLAADSTDLRRRYQHLSQVASAGILLATRDGQVLECNDNAARMFGYANAGAALSRTDENRFRVYAFEGALLARLELDGKLENIEWSTLDREGRLVRFQESAALVEAPEGNHTHVERILTDVTKTHKINEEIRRMRRMESAGDPASVTVKSLQDLCAALAQSGASLLEAADDAKTVRHLAESLLNDARRGVKHARQFLSVAQRSDREPTLINLNDFLRANDALVHSLIGDDIDLQTTLAPRIGMVSADQNELVQLISNLLANSREALPLGGIVTIETSNVEIDGRTSEHPAIMRPGIYVRMLFGTDGCAVQPERRNASIRAVVEKLGGHMETVTDPKLGNVHKVYLPRIEHSSGRIDLMATTAGA
ncbi:MAG TPA: PAS domain S-box protein, partial [Acidobacteriota bacterium]|nr:PAS domain S-box protein [Acidobacteriota bacterium]